MSKYCICYIFSLLAKVFNLTFHLACVCIFSPFGNVTTDSPDSLHHLLLIFQNAKLLELWVSWATKTVEDESEAVQKSLAQRKGFGRGVKKKGWEVILFFYLPVGSTNIYVFRYVQVEICIGLYVYPSLYLAINPSNIEYLSVDTLVDAWNHGIIKKSWAPHLQDFFVHIPMIKGKQKVTFLKFHVWIIKMRNTHMYIYRYIF